MEFQGVLLSSFSILMRFAVASAGILTMPMLTGCGPSLEKQIATAKSEWQQLRDSESSAWTECKYGPAPTLQDRQSEGEEALAQWDAAAADAVDNMSLEQEWDARVAISRETGVAPSRVDLKGIYKVRGEQARAALARKRQQEKIMADINADAAKIEKDRLCEIARDISRRKIEKYREMMKLYRDRSG